jgi:hypothetical protein
MGISYDASGRMIYTEDDRQMAPGGGSAHAREQQQSPGGLEIKETPHHLPNYYKNLAAIGALEHKANYQNQMTPAQAAAVKMNRASELETRRRQLALLSGLEQNAAGNGPSVANALNREQTDAGIRAAMASGGGVMGALGTGSKANLQTALGTADMRAQEQQQAWGALQNAAYGVRGADITGDVEEARLRQQWELANAGFRQQGTLANQNASLASVANRLDAARMQGAHAQSGVASSIDWRGLSSEKERLGLRRSQAQEDKTAAAVGTGVQMAGSVMMMSDARQKTDIEPGDAKLRNLLDTIEPYAYEYKDTSLPGTSPGKHVSVMAQDLERSEIGKRAVVERDGNKMVDYAKLIPASVAAVSMLNKDNRKLAERLALLESKVK